MLINYQRSRNVKFANVDNIVVLHCHSHYNIINVIRVYLFFVNGIQSALLKKSAFLRKNTEGLHHIYYVRFHIYL